MSGWNFADAWETVAEEVPGTPALLRGDRIVEWGDFDSMADGIADTILNAGVTAGTTFAQYMANRPEYLISVFAAFKLGLPPVNTNYRYVDDELVYLWDNSDAAVVAFDGQYAERIEAVRDRVPGVKLWLWVDDGHGGCPEWATPFARAAKSATGRVQAPWGRSPGSLYLLYTGGTTGMPKGVMWRNDDLLLALNDGAPRRRQLPEEADYDYLRKVASEPGPRNLPACPLMHGTGSFSAFTALMTGGSAALLAGDRFDAVELLDIVERHRVNSMAIVGDAFCRPIVAALDAEPDRWDLSSLKVVTSSGVMWSQPMKEALLHHHPRLLLADSLGSSEAIGMASSVSRGPASRSTDDRSGAARSAATASFRLSPNARVIADDGTEVKPGDDRIGKVAFVGHTPIGYYKDPVKSAETFNQVDGRTYSMPGDYARVELDGTLTLLGRGSVCINTGGEKVFPEEVEEALKEHAAIDDAVVVGVPDDRFGQAITAVIQPRVGADVAEDEAIAHVKDRLAAYKAPKRVLFVDSLGRAANGKIDYKRWTVYAVEELVIDASS